MTQPLYEQYKDALRRGHVAALRNRLDAALLAYGEAAEIAPDRPLPHVSLGGVLHRLGRNGEALVAYGNALDRAPADEGALSGRAQVLLALGRRVQAADALDRLAAAQEASGALSQACETARRSLELAESRTRRRHLESIVSRLADAPPTDDGQATLARARGVLGTVADPVRATGDGRRTRTGRGAGGDDAAAGPVADPDGAATDADGTPPSPAVAPAPDGAALAVRAESLLDAGESVAARDTFLAAAASHRSASRPNAAIDACYFALGIAPADPDLHVALAEIYLELGWRGQALDKLRLLDRLAEVSGDDATRARVASLVAARLGDDERRRSAIR